MIFCCEGVGFDELGQPLPLLPRYLQPTLGSPLNMRALFCAS